MAKSPHSGPRDRSLHDEPISHANEDQFRRDALASRVASVLETISDDGGSSVVAIVGPWGSGKTSLLSLVREHLEDSSSTRTVQFNPWMVASVESLLQDFFSTLLTGIEGGGDDERRTRARELVAKYGRAASPLLKVVPVAGTALAAAGEVAAQFAASPSLAQLRQEAEEGLASLNQPVVVVVDDIDRLQGDELLTLFKLIRLVGRLPNVHYLLAFDDETVTDVLTGQHITAGAPQRALNFLEKIVQVRVDIPPLHNTDIDALVEEGCARAFSEANVVLTHSEQQRLTEIYERLLRPRLRQPRQIKRLFVQLEATLPLVAGEVNVLDFLLLTFIRVTYPALYGKLAQSGDVLTYSLSTAFKLRHTKREERRAQWELFVAEPGVEDEQGVLSLLAELFPVIDDAIRGRQPMDAAFSAERRIGAPEYFDRYFQLGVPPGDVPDARIASALRAIVAGGETTGDRDWLKGALVKHRELALQKMRAAWSPATVEESARLVRLLVEVYEELSEHRGEILGPGFHVEGWIGELLSQFGGDGVLDAALALSSGRRLVCRALALAAQDHTLSSSPGFAVAASTVTDMLQDWLRSAIEESVESQEDVVWMLHDALRFTSKEAVRTWLREVLDVSAWTTRDFVGCFTPLAHMVGVGASEPFLSEFALSALVEMLPLQDVFDRLALELDETQGRPPGRVGLEGRDRDTSFSRRIEVALAALADLRKRGPVERQLDSLPVVALHPLRWASGSPAEVVLRAAVAFPAPLAPGPDSKNVLAESIDTYRSGLEDVLNRSRLTQWIQGKRNVWHWVDEPRWTATATGGTDFCELLFKPGFDQTSTVPFSARCCIQIGEAMAPDDEVVVPAIQGSLDLALNPLELDNERHPSSTRHQTTPPPAPGALTLQELAEFVRALVGIAEIANAVAPLGVVPGDGGQIGVWLVLSGTSVDRVVNVSKLERRLGGPERSEWVIWDRWPLSPSVWGISSERAMAARFVQHILETSGYKDLQSAVSVLR